MVGKVLGVVFEWLYLATLVACFVLALGNRPGGSNKFYMTMVYFWICIMIYLAFAAVFVTVKSIEKQVQNKNFTLEDVFKNEQFFTIVVSLAATYVMWFVASLIFLDPWHMFTCVRILLSKASITSNATSSSNTSSCPRPTSTSSTSTPSATRTTSHGAPRATNRRPSCHRPT